MSKHIVDEAFFLKVNQVLQSVSLPSSAEVGKLPPMVFIVGLPRSGSTLLSQLLSRHLEVGYINNLIARFWLRPSVGIRLSQVLLNPDSRTNIPLQSRFGVTDGVSSPHEFGYFWNYWFKYSDDKSHRLLPADRMLIDKQRMKETIIEEILKPFDQLVLIKNLGCGVQARVIAELFPETMFIHIRRDLSDIGYSILSSRKQLYGSYQTWFSLKPSKWPYPALENKPGAQVAHQVVDGLNDIEDELNSPDIKSLDVHYSDLCQNPAHEIEKIIDWVKTCSGYNIPVAKSLPSGFSQQNGHNLPIGIKDEFDAALLQIQSLASS